MHGRRTVVVFWWCSLLAILVVSPLPSARASHRPSPHTGSDGNGAADLVTGAPRDNLGGDAATVDAGAVFVMYAAPGYRLTTVGDQWHQDQETDGWDHGGPGAMVDEAEASDEFGYALTVGDWNGDRCVDLAVGVHWEGIGGAPRAGAVHVLYGRAHAGLAYPSNALWHQGNAGMDGAVEPDDAFGEALASGDFDGDGFDDLAIGVPNEAVSSPAVTGAGAVQIMYGSQTGLSAAGNNVWDQGSFGLRGKPEVQDLFGQVLASDDFDGDGYDDLAVGIPLEDVGDPGVQDAGAVQVLYGSAGGLSARDQLWSQNGAEGGADIQDQPERNDWFGAALAAGDFDGDGYGDLAIGVPREATPVPQLDAGAVHILRGSPSGLTSQGNQLFDQDDLRGDAESGDQFGFALAVGDLDGDGYDDLVAGAPFEDYGAGPVADAGVVAVIYGTAGGLHTLGSHSWSQDSPGIEGQGEAGDQFGRALAVGDFDWDGYDDLAVGVPFEGVGCDSENYEDGGAVNVLYGAPCGLCSAAHDQIWTKCNDGLAGDPQAGDRYGWALAAAPGMLRRAHLPQILQE